MSTDINDPNKYTAKTPLEELRSKALEHYREASSKLCHWSGFVESAILSYNPEASHQPKEDKPEWEIVGLMMLNGMVLKKEKYQNKECFDSLVSDGSFEIHSVKRLSDSDVFTVGDEVEYLQVKSKIQGFEEHVEGMCAILKWSNDRLSVLIRDLKKPKEEVKEPSAEVEILREYGSDMRHHVSDKGFYHPYTLRSYQREIPKEKLPLIKQAIEGIINS